MIIRSVKEINNTLREVMWGNGISKRFLIEEDGMGFSLTETTVNAGSKSLLEYKHHLEACYCIEGEGEIKLMNGDVHKLIPGTMYAPNKHDKHFLIAKTNMRLICVFSPALKGTEKHDLNKNNSSSY